MMQAKKRLVKIHEDIKKHPYGGTITVRKLIFCNLDLLKIKLDVNDYHDIDWDSFDCDKQQRRQKKFIKKFYELASDTDNKVYFYSRKPDVLQEVADFFANNGYINFKFKRRDEIKDFVSKHREKNNYFVFVGSKNKDFELAVNTRSLYIVPTWLPLEGKAQRYGVHVDTVKQLCKFIMTLNNQNSWYSKLQIDAKTTCYSLMDARYGYYAKTNEERDMLLHFQELLKEGKSRNYYQILLYHFLAGMTNSPDFNDIELVGMIPSSDCNVNEDLYSFMDQIRCLKGIQPVRRKYPEDFSNKYKNLLIRHTSKNQAHVGRTLQERANLGGKDEFATICINPDYKKRITKLKEEGRFNVCIFDDYMTHGNSFNSVRALLDSLGANKIVCVSLGLFRQPFQKRDYIFMGDVYGKNYSFQMESYSVLNNFEINEDAKREVADLFDIFNL